MNVDALAADSFDEFHVFSFVHEFVHHGIEDGQNEQCKYGGGDEPTDDNDG